MANYKKRTKADETFREGGYKGVVYFAPTADVATWARPTSTPSVLGDKVKITTAHQFATGKGAISLVCKKHSVTSTAETVGEPGARSLNWKANFVILGDSASTLETVQEQLNDDLVFWIKDQDCLNTNELIQLGDDCTPVDVTVTFDGKTTAEGLKEYTLEVAVKAKKFFYSAALVEKPDASSAPAPTIVDFSNDYNGAIGSTAVIYVDADSSTNSPLTYQWYKGLPPTGTLQTGATNQYFAIVGGQSSHNGWYYCKVTDANGNSINSAAISITFS